MHSLDYSLEEITVSTTLLLLLYPLLLFCWAEEASATGVKAETGNSEARVDHRSCFPFLLFLFFVTSTADVEAPDTEGREGRGAVEAEGI